MCCAVRASLAAHGVTSLPARPETHVQSPAGGPGSPPQDPCWEKPVDRGAWWAAVHGVAESDVTEVTGHTRAYTLGAKSLKRSINFTAAY